MFAPMAGDEARRQLGQAARKLKDGSQDRVDQLRNVIKDGAEDLGAAIDAGKEAFRRNSV